MNDRRIAEAARRRAQELDGAKEPGLVAERAECVKVWNTFCAAEQRRMDAAAKGRRDPKVQVYETYRKLGWS